MKTYYLFRESTVLGEVYATGVADPTIDVAECTPTKAEAKKFGSAADAYRFGAHNKPLYDYFKVGAR